MRRAIQRPAAVSHRQLPLRSLRRQREREPRQALMPFLRRINNYHASVCPIRAKRKMLCRAVISFHFHFQFVVPLNIRPLQHRRRDDRLLRCDQRHRHDAHRRVQLVPPRLDAVLKLQRKGRQRRRAQLHFKGLALREDVVLAVVHPHPHLAKIAKEVFHRRQFHRLRPRGHVVAFAHVKSRIFPVRRPVRRPQLQRDRPAFVRHNARRQPQQRQRHRHRSGQQPLNFFHVFSSL